MSQLQAAQLLSAAQQHLKPGQFPKAIEILQQLLAIAPESFAAHSLLGIAYRETGNFDESVKHFRTALALQNTWAEGHELLGRTLAAQGMYHQAAEAFGHAVRLKPQNVESLNNLGTVLRSLGRFDEAITHLRAAVRLRPDQAEIHHNLGNALLEAGQTIEALAELRQAVLLRPGLVQLYQGLGNALISVGNVAEAVDCFRRALRINPSHYQIHSSLLMALHYLDSANHNPQELFEEHLEYNRRHIENLSQSPSFANDVNSDRRLRIGYVSADFRRHSVAFFIEPILAHHDRSKFDIICYADVPNPDDVTRRLKKFASQWQNIANQTDADVAEQIRRDRIDILVDLSGHSGGGRMALFGQKPAPVQVTYLWYPNTTGVSTIDFRITDCEADPPGDSDRRCVEQLIRLVPTFLCFLPPTDSSDVGPPPVLKNGHITFGSFNNLAKISPGTIELWSAVMNTVPGSRMLIKARGLQNPQIADRFAESFFRHGIERSRLSFLGHESSTTLHLARYHQMDIALDTFPYTGTTTTCEALWMGVPIVTQRGRIHAARVGASLLTALGRPEWIGENPGQFAQIANHLAADIGNLTRIRSTLRQQLSSSPITNAPAFIHQLESAFQQMLKMPKP